MPDEKPEPPPPMVVAENLQRKLALEPSRHHPVLRHAVWVAAHLGFGMTVGAVAALWPKRAETSRSARGYGVAVWTAMYGITLPLSGLYPSLRRDNRLRAAETLLSHLVYAATLARVS